MKVKVCILQFERAANYKKNIEKAKTYLEKTSKCDFALIGGEFSLKESKNIDPYSPMIDLAKTFNCNIVAPINANFKRYPKSREKGFSSMHIFDRTGDVVAIQDKQNFYPKEKPWFKTGTETKVFEVDGIKIGLARGNDILNPEYTQKLKNAEILFVSTMAVDNIMLEASKVVATENRSYVVLSSFIGKYVGMNFIGNAAVIGPISVPIHIPSLKSNVIKHFLEEGILEDDLDIDNIRKLKSSYPLK